MKIKMPKIVEMQGDEMTRIIWDDIKEILLAPYLDLDTDFYDLSVTHRDETDDRVTMQAAEAVKRLRVGVKCATITPNAERVREYSLKKMWQSPNGTIRAVLDGTVFRAPIIAKGIRSYIPAWKKPIIIARHAYGDVYKDVEFSVPAGAEVRLVCGGEEKTVHSYKGAGVALAMHNTDESITAFARSCFRYGLEMKLDVWFGTKDTISKLYDGRFKDIFQTVFEKEFKEAFKEAGLSYEYSLIDDSVSRVIRSSGGFIWALKNYDGDVMSDMVATAYGSLAMMTSVLVSPDGCYEYEAAHGTVTRHYYKHLKGEETSTNSVATIFAWSGALKKAGELHRARDLVKFAKSLEKATLQTIESGEMTGDLIPLFKRGGIIPKKLSTRGFIEAIAGRLNAGRLNTEH